MTVLLCFNYIGITRYISPWQVDVSTSVYHPGAEYSAGEPGSRIGSLKYISKYHPAVWIPKVQQQGIEKDTDLSSAGEKTPSALWGGWVFLVKAPIL